MVKPVTNAERKRKHRNNMSEERKEEIREADQKRKQEEREIPFVPTKHEVEERRRKDRERQQRHRTAKRAAKVVVINLPFKNKQ